MGWRGESPASAPRLLPRLLAASRNRTMQGNVCTQTTLLPQELPDPAQESERRQLHPAAPSVWGPETKAGGVAQQRGQQSRRGHRQPRCGREGSSGSPLSRDRSFPSCRHQKESSVPACGISKSQMVNIYLESRGPGFIWPEDDENSTLMGFEKCIHSFNKYLQPSGPRAKPRAWHWAAGVD